MKFGQKKPLPALDALEAAKGNKLWKALFPPIISQTEEESQEMKYPIDAEKYIAAMRMEFGPSKAAEEAHRIVIPLINTAYQDGLDGKGGYPEDPEQMLADVAEENGVGATESLRKMVRKLINWRNAAYREGRRAGEGATE